MATILTSVDRQIFKSNQGSILVIVLVVMAISTALTLYVLERSRLTVVNSTLILEKLQAKLEAESLLEKLKFYLASSPFESDSVVVASSPDLNVKVPRLFLTGEPLTIEGSTVTLRDTSSLLPATQLDARRFKRLVVAAGGTPEQSATLSDSYQDWIDTDNLKRLNGAEEYYYRFDQGYGFKPRNSKGIQAVAELQLLRGFAENGLFERLQKDLVLYGSGAFNVNTADAKMIAVALDIPIDQARQLVTIRENQGPLNQRLLTLVTGKNFSGLYQGISAWPGRSVKITIHSKVGRAEERLSALIDFQASQEELYKVLEYSQ